jgi:CRISPR-associated protein Cmr4
MSNEPDTHPSTRYPQLERKLLYLFTRTPLHVGAGASVGAIDQPIVRERHTGFPIIPASSLKGTFADAWDAELEQDGKKFLRITSKEIEREGKKETVPDRVEDAAWLFGSNNDKVAFTGALQFSEARLLAFPIRSAKGSFAWITCPLMLRRAARDGVFPGIKSDGTPDPEYLPSKSPADEEGIWSGNVLDLGGQIVLEEYTFKRAKNGEEDISIPSKLATGLAGLMAGDPVWQEVSSRLVILSDGMMSFFARNACEVAQHVRISDETGTAEGRALFNQENVPSETLFYSVLQAFDERTASKPKDQRRDAAKALTEFGNKVDHRKVFQFGGDASTGLGYCTVKLDDPMKEETTNTPTPHRKELEP